MSRERTPRSSRKGLKITDDIRKAYDRRDKTSDNDRDARPLPPNVWAHAMRRDEFFRPIKRPVTARIDADIVAWLQAKGEGYQTRMNAILREAMNRELNNKTKE